MRSILRKLVGPVLLATFITAAALFPTAAKAQNCSGGTLLSPTEMQTLLASGRYACGSSGGDSWNETLSGGASGTVTDYKKGPNDPRDPSSAVGTYSIITYTGGTGLITYVYGSGGVYSYQIRAPGTTASTTTGTYSFCGQGGAGNFSIVVSNSPSGCLPP